MAIELCIIFQYWSYWSHYNAAIDLTEMPSYRPLYNEFVQVIVRAKKEGYSVAEVPIIFVDRIFGVSKLGPSEIISYLV